MRDFRAAYNFALKVVDDPDALPGNPVAAVTFNKERASNRVIMPEDLADWWARVQALPNPLRRDMHKLGLLSGLRRGPSLRCAGTGCGWTPRQSPSPG